MDRTVKRDIIDIWLDKHGPDGMLRLADKSGVSSSTITKARLGMVPKKQVTRDRLCSAMGVPEEALFPLLQKRRGKAS